MKRSRATHRFGGRRSDSTHGKDKAAYLQGKRKRQHKITGMRFVPTPFACNFAEAYTPHTKISVGHLCMIRLHRFNTDTTRLSFGRGEQQQQQKIKTKKTFAGNISKKAWYI